jgi:hypothetical protein
MKLAQWLLMSNTLTRPLNDWLMIGEGWQFAKTEKFNFPENDINFQSRWSSYQEHRNALYLVI